MLCRKNEWLIYSIYGMFTTITVYTYDYNRDIFLWLSECLIGFCGLAKLAHTC